MTHDVTTCIEALHAGSKTACQARLTVVVTHQKLGNRSMRLVDGHHIGLANSWQELMRRQTCTDESIARGKGDHSKRDGRDQVGSSIALQEVLCLLPLALPCHGVLVAEDLPQPCLQPILLCCFLGAWLRSIAVSRMPCSS